MQIVSFVAAQILLPVIGSAATVASTGCVAKFQAKELGNYPVLLSGDAPYSDSSPQRGVARLASGLQSRMASPIVINGSAPSVHKERMAFATALWAR
ncbi:hypothetical protein MRX96_028187 [Rhipicephalus microplus]